VIALQQYSVLLGPTPCFIGFAGAKSKTVELCCRVMDEKKTEENLVVAIRGFCEEFKIKFEKVRAAVTDGGANIKNACKTLFGAEKHVPCTAHKLNTIGQKSIGNSAAVPSERQAPTPDEAEEEDDDGDLFNEVEEAEESSLRELITKVKKIVRFFKQSSVANTALTQLQNAERGKTEATALKVIQEVRTRWNSCYDMLNRFVSLIQYLPLSILRQSNPNYFTNFARYLDLAPLITRVLLDVQRSKNTRAKPPEIIRADEEETLAEVRDLLSGLARATKEVCMPHCTLSKVIPVIKNLRLVSSASFF